MTGETIELRLLYCEGWDPAEGAVVGPLTPEAARHRDASGEPYVAVLFAGGMPKLLIEVCWRYFVVTAWEFDERGRRTTRHDLRLLEDGRLLLIGQTVWRYADADQPEFDGRAARHRRETVDDGVRVIEEPGGDRGGSRHTFERVDRESLRLAVPAFGDWTALIRPADAGSADVTLVVRDDLPDGVRLSFGGTPWSPPRPLRPNEPDLLFRPGARYATRWGVVTVEVHDLGVTVLPTGRVVAAGPGFFEAPVPFVAEVPAGAYPTLLSVARWAGDEDVRVAAARLVIRDEPVASWELAVCPGQDPRTLGDGEFLGFGVEVGLAFLGDAAVVPAVKRFADDGFPGAGDVWGESVVRVRDEESGADAFVFSSGWGDGSYPTWVGRTRDGGIGCLLADMLVLHHAEPLAAASTAGEAG
ncbi:DUF4241 domain-containing protein [Longispora sp. K20-0274]|uniref:DUF4241 domain-containing protein n=1 Tax=Longispora sp. K20-0274 TaxID=3088255 RepID=UPI00399BF76B